MLNIKRIKQNNYPHNKTVLEVPCPFCGDVSKIEIPTDEWLDGLKDYKNGMHIQYAFPKLSSDQRELLITGICKKCWCL